MAETYGKSPISGIGHAHYNSRRARKVHLTIPSLGWFFPTLSLLSSARPPYRIFLYYYATASRNPRFYVTTWHHRCMHIINCYYYNCCLAPRKLWSGDMDGGGDSKSRKQYLFCVHVRNIINYNVHWKISVDFFFVSTETFSYTEFKNMCRTLGLVKLNIVTLNKKKKNNYHQGTIYR